MQDYSARRRSRNGGRSLLEKKDRPKAFEKKEEKIDTAALFAVSNEPAVERKKPEKQVILPKHNENPDKKPEKMPKEPKKPGSRLSLKITALVLAVLILAGGTLTYAKWYQILDLVDNWKQEEVNIVPLSETDPDYLAARYTYKPLSYISQTSGGAIYDKTLALEALPGVDFYTKSGMTFDEVMKELDNLIAFALSMKATELILPLQCSEGSFVTVNDFDTLFNGQLPAYLVTKGSENGIKISFSFSPLSWVKGGSQVTLDPTKPSDRALISTAAAQIAALGAASYVLTDCEYNPNQGTYADYAASNIGSGFEVYKRSALSDTLFDIAQTLRAGSDTVLVGVRVGPIWQLSSNSSDGIDAVCDYESYTDGYADTKAWLSNGIFDYFQVEDYGSLSNKDQPFASIFEWWTRAAGTDIPLMVVHAGEKIASTETGWSLYDQIPKQILEAQKSESYAGSIISGVSKLVKYSEIPAVITNSFSGEVDGDDILRKLVITSPNKKDTTTYESKVTLSGSSDPNFSVILNGKPIERTSKGYFSFNFDLAVGKNTYVFEHKGTKVTYTVDRKILVVKTVDPTKSITIFAGTPIVFSATALKGSKVYADIDGTRIDMHEDAILLDESNESLGDYINYTGSYTVPESSKSRTISGIKITGVWDGYTTAKDCADVKVKEIDKSTVRVAKVISEAGAEVFRYGTVDDKSVPTAYPLPAGTRDFIIGEVTLPFSEDGASHVYVYYLLQSGKRIYKSKDGVASTDVIVEAGSTVPYTTISNPGFEVTSDYTKLYLDMSSKVPFTVELLPQSYVDATSTVPNFTIGDFTAQKIKLTFNYVTDASALPALSGSPIFTSVGNWEKDGSNYSITLTLAKSFYGMYTEYSGDTLVFSFNNPPVISTSSNSYGYSLEGITVLLDAGHGGNSSGAIGANPNYPEKRVNLDLAYKVADILRGLGAKVIMMRSADVYISIENRAVLCGRYKPDIFISLHHNWAPAVSAYGTDSFYFMPFSKDLANSIYNRVTDYYDSGMYPGANSSAYKRGCNYYPFYVTRYWYCPSTLVEYGFMSNSAELQKLIDPNNQDGFARATVKGIIDYFASNGIVGSGSTTSSQPTASSEPASSQENSIPSSLPQSSTATSSTPSQG